MPTISKSKLKAHMLSNFRQIEQTGEEVIVTDNNRPVPRIHPVKASRTVEVLFAPCKGKIVFHEDPDTPTSFEWSEAYTRLG
ncbi:MAG: type II toxin-antitoxin system Phd/YefM family antitoxin [Syntrophobacteraceae bacterium]